MAPRPAARGFTLIELMIGLVIGIIALSAISAAFISQIQQYRSHANRRAAQANARRAMSVIEDSVRSAGFGVDPDRAIIAFDSFNLAAPLAAPAAADFPDALTLHERDPDFRRRLSSVSTTELKVTPALTSPLRAGQILLVLCAGAKTYAYVTVAQNVAASPGAPNDTISLSTAPATESPVSFPGARFHQQAQLSNACFSSTADPATVVKVNRTSYFIGAYDDDGVAGTPDVPYLMTHAGVDVDGNGAVDAADATPVAAGIEQLQVAYVMNSATGTIPAVRGTNGQDVPWGDAWAATAATPGFGVSYDDAARTTNNPANIRQVRMTVVARGPQRELDSRGRISNLGEDENEGAAGALLADGTTVPWRQLENLTTNPAQFNPRGGGYARSVARISVSPRNLMMRSQFLPVNAGGGS